MDPPHPPHPGPPPGEWPAGSGGQEQFRSPHGVQPFSWPLLSPPSALPPRPSSTCFWGGDPLGEVRCLLFGPSLTSPFVEGLHGRNLATWGIPSPNFSKSRRPFSWSSGVSSWGYPPSVALLRKATSSVLYRRGNAQELMLPRCLVLWALNSGRLWCWQEWWPTHSPWTVTAPILSSGIFLWCQSSFPTILPTKPPWERWISTWYRAGQCGRVFCWLKGPATTRRAPYLPLRTSARCQCRRYGVAPDVKWNFGTPRGTYPWSS